MKKFLFLLCSLLLSVAGAWATTPGTLVSTKQITAANQFADGKLYAVRVNGGSYITESGGQYGAPNAQNAITDEALYYIVPNADGETFTVKNLSTSNYWGELTGSAAAGTFTPSTEPADWTFTFNGGNVQASSGGYYINRSSGVMHGWTTGINLQIYEVNNFEVNFVTALDDLSNNKCYVVYNQRAAWNVADGATSANAIAADVDAVSERFALINYNDAYYIYSVNAKAFLTSANTLGDPEAVTIVDSGVEGYPFFFKFDDSHNINVSGGRVLINGWGTVDEGNANAIIEAADFDPFEAIAVLDPSTAQPKNLDFSESTPVTVGIHTYEKDITGENVAQMQPVEGWTIAQNGDARAAGVFAYGSENFVGGDGYIAPAANPEGNVEGNALGLVAVWSATAQYTQKVILEPANYILTIPVYNSKGGASVPVKSLIGFIAEDGTEYLAPAKAYPVDTWTNEVITFSLNEKTTGYLTLGYQGQNVGSGSAQHLFIDGIKIETATNAEVVRAELIAALAEPTATVMAHAGVGTGLFMIPVEAFAAFADAVAAAQAVADNDEATAEELEAAIEALAAAVEAYTAAGVNVPEADATYTFQQKSSGLYLALDAANDKVMISETAQAFTFEAGEGGYYLINEEGAVGFAGTNNWTMSANAEKKMLISPTPVEIGGGLYYTLNEAKGMIATDAETEGSACFTDKSVAKSGDKAYWTIAIVRSEAYLALEDEIAKAEALIAATEIENGKAELQAAIDAAQAELGKTDEEMVAATEALQAAEEAFVAAQQEASVVYIETDLTNSFSALTVASNWHTGAGGTAGYTATNFCPMVTTNAGQTVQVCEFYEANCNRTGDLLYQTVSGLAEGTYRIELYGAAAYTFGRGFASTAFSEGTWNAGDHIDENTGVVLYAETSEGNYGGEIPIYYATDFPDGAATVVLDGVQVGANGQVKIGMSKTSTSTNWHVIQLKGVTAKVLGSDALAAVVALADAIDPETLPAKAYEELAAVVAENNKTYATAEAYVAAIDAINAAVVKANKYVAANAYFVKMADVLDQTNVYTQEAYNAYYGDWKADFENATLDDAVLTTLTADAAYASVWHSSNNIDDILLSAWTINDVQAKDFDTALYINTWSVEGDTDGSEFKVPFFEYWTGDANSLEKNTLTATLTGVEPGLYNVTAWVRVRGKNGYTAPTYGITADVNRGTAVDLAAGEQVGNSQFYLAEFKVLGEVAENGVLKFNINVAADNNISWLSFKNVKYVATTEEKEAYEEALATLKDGYTYRISTEVNGAQYYLKSDGYLTADEAEATTFTLNAVNASGTVFETGWDLGYKFTNPNTGGNTTFTNVGHIMVGSNNRNDWERQVFFRKNGKYAVRATNANNTAWGSNTYWDVFTTAELPEAGYSLEAAYVWNVDIYVDMTELNNIVAELEAAIAATDTYNDENGAADVATAALAAVKAAEYATIEEVAAAVEQVRTIGKTFFAAIKVAENKEIEVTNFYIVNATPTSNINGWEGDKSNAFDTGNNVAEFWDKSGATFHQVVTLPAGDYKLAVVALQRTDMTGYVYAGDVQTVIATVDSGTANSRTQANNWFNEGNGVNDVYFLLEDAADVEIGLKADDATGDHWTVWRSFTLTKLFEGTVVGVGNVETDGLNRNSDVIYDLTGRRVSKAVKGGIYILNGKKVLVK